VGGVLLTLGLLGQLGGFSSYASAAGVATLLAVLGYSAMRTGTLLHGVVLIAATGPLIAYAWSGRGDADDPSGIAGALAVAGVCLALWILASLPWPLRSPRALAKQLRIRLVDALRPHQRLLWSLLAGFVVICLLTAGVVWLLVTQLSDQLLDTVDAVTSWVPDNLGWLAPVAAVVSVLVGAWSAWVRGDGLRLRTETRKQRLQLPAGVAAMWAVVYGALCWIVALGLLWWLRTHPGDPGPTHAAGDPRAVLEFSAWWLGLLAAVLTLVVPFWVTFTLRRRLNRQILQLTPDGTSQEDFVTELRRRGLAFVYLVDADSQGNAVLTQRGTWLWTRFRSQARLTAPAPVPPGG
jgi:hypothetical protein